MKGLAVWMWAALLAGAVAVTGTIVPETARASEIRYVVNNIPVTSYDIARRAAFLRLQRQRGNLNAKAAEEMIEQALKSAEMARLRVNVPKRAVDQAFNNFARQNRLSTAQLTQIMGQSGVTVAHFKEFIRVQIGWGSALRARFRAEGVMSEQDVVQRMLEQGGEKPTATEYMLQQVIFVVPAADRSSILSRRKREADAMRTRFAGCDTTREFAKGLIDVTVRDLGRVLEPELPPDWADQVKATQEGKATVTRVTDRGVEFIGICRMRQVSDDRVAQMVFTNEGDLDDRNREFNDKYLKELRDKARIIER